MKKHKTLFFKSVTKKKLFWVYLLTSIPLFLCILIGSEYGKRLLLQQSIQYNHNTLSLQLATVDTSLDHISNYLASFLLDSQNYHTLAHGESDPQEELAILDSFTDYLDTYNSSASLFFYIPDQDILIFQSANYDSYNDRQEMRRYIRQACRKKTFPATSPQIRGWSFLRIGQKSYLMELMEYQNVYVGAFGAGEYIFSDFKDLTASTHGVFILSNQDAVEDLLFGAPEINRAHCVEIPVDSAKNHYRIILYIPMASVLGAFSWFQYAILILAVATLLFVTIMLIVTWKQMISPVLQIITAMEAVEQGDFDSRLPIPDTNDEFAKLTETFNYMISQIHDLKLQIYEEKLNRVYAELQYLTLQIKPHFFLNCLNLIYSLGLSGRSELIVDFSSTLMKYFRYLFKSSDSMVVLSEELAHVKNYLHIQQIRFQNDLHPQFTIDPDTEKMKIPVLTLHTFVENVFKHGCPESSPMEIRITAMPEKREEQTYLSLIIEDNGLGFSEETLKKLSIEEPPSQKTGEKHIGIRNVKQRLSYIYGNHYTLIFENRPEGGARIRLLLPQMHTAHPPALSGTSHTQKGV